MKLLKINELRLNHEKIDIIVKHLTFYKYMRECPSNEIRSILFPGGTVPPKTKHAGNLTISLDSLPMSVPLKVTCDIENPNYNKPYPVVIWFEGGSLNGVSSPSGQYLLNHQISTYTRQIQISGGSSSSSHLVFINYDDSDAVYVKNCIAIYATN